MGCHFLLQGIFPTQDNEPKGCTVLADRVSIIESHRSPAASLLPNNFDLTFYTRHPRLDLFFSYSVQWNHFFTESNSRLEAEKIIFEIINRLMILKSNQDMVIQCSYTSIPSWCEMCTHLIIESDQLALGRIACSEQELNGRNHIKRSIDSPCTFKVITFQHSRPQPWEMGTKLKQKRKKSETSRALSFHPKRDCLMPDT